MEGLFLLLIVSVLIGIAALLKSRDNTAQIRRLARRIDELSIELAPSRAARSVERAPDAVAPTPPAAPAEEEPPAPPPVDVPEAPEPAPLPTRAPELREDAWASASFDDEPAERFSAKELEKRLGARLPVWIGAIALALAGAFLVKLSFDRGWLGPAVRITLGVLFGIGLLGGGEWLRRSSKRVALGLSAAGISVLFVSFYAGVNLYALIPSWAGFLLMALTTATAVLLSLRQGPMVAALGLVGGFLTPYLIGSDEPRPQVLFTYLLLLQAGLLAVSRRKGWWPFAALSFFAGLMWVAAWLVGGYQPVDTVYLGAFVLLSAGLLVASGALAAGGPSPAFRHRAAELSWLATLGGFAALAGVTVRADFEPSTWALLALLGAGALVLARLDERYHGIAWVAAAVPAFLFTLWVNELENDQLDRFLWSVVLLGALYVAGAYVALWHSQYAGRWAWLSTAGAVAYTLLGYWAASGVERSLPWGGICLALALVFLAAAVPLARRRETVGIENALAAACVAVTSFVGLALPMELQREWLSVAWAAEVVALVWLAGRLRVRVLTHLAWIVASLVAIRLLLNPWVFTYPIGSHPLFNWLTYGYGVPVLAFCVAAWLAHRQGDERLSVGLQWGALALGTVLLTLLVRQYFHPGRPAQFELYLTEGGTLTVVWLGLAWGLLRVRSRRPLDSLGQFANPLAMLALVFGLLTSGLSHNPAWAHHDVGSLPVVNWLLWIYGVPAVLLVSVSRERHSHPWLRLGGQTGAMVMSFLLVTLEVRQAFRGSFLDVGNAAGAEQYSYSAAWIGLGLLLLALGIVRKGRLVRLSSLVVMLLAVGKVFLYDMAELQDFYRVFSFLGLGLSLLLIAWLYQRFVFGEEGA